MNAAEEGKCDQQTKIKCNFFESTFKFESKLQSGIVFARFFLVCSRIKTRKALWALWHSILCN